MPPKGKQQKWETSVFEENSFTFGAFFFPKYLAETRLMRHHVLYLVQAMCCLRPSLGCRKADKWRRPLSPNL
eukprot:1296647-Amphidinium_carterae.1